MSSPRLNGTELRALWCFVARPQPRDGFSRPYAAGTLHPSLQGSIYGVSRKAIPGLRPKIAVGLISVPFVSSVGGRATPVQKFSRLSADGSCGAHSFCALGHRCPGGSGAVGDLFVDDM